MERCLPTMVGGRESGKWDGDDDAGENMPCSFSFSITITIFCSIFCAARVLSCFDRAEDQACACMMTSRSILLNSENGSSVLIKQGKFGP